MNRAEKLAAFIAQTQANVRRLGETFEDPEDDWESVGFIESDSGNAIIGLDGHFFVDDDSKDMLAFFLKHAMSEFNAERYAILFNVHGLENPSPEDWEAHRNGKRLHEFENSYELLIMVAGDAEQEIACQARINRDGKTPPTLDAWEIVENFGGRFANLNERMASV